MKNLLALMIVGIFIVSMVGVVSATTAPITTIVAGTIFNEDYTETMEEANVTVSCVHNNVTSVGTTESNSEGVYGVEFIVAECGEGDIVTVFAESQDGTLSGTETGIVQEFGLTVNLAIINVTIPEFGLLIGAFTLVAGAGIFFLVRRK